MKYLVYLVMCFYILFVSACGNKENTPQKEQIEKETNDHGHEHSDDHNHEHDHEEEHNHDEEGNHSSEDHDHTSEKKQGEKTLENSIILTAEQAQNILNFKVEEIKSNTFYEILKTSGQILSAPGDEAIISATMSGIVNISNAKMVEGLSVSKGQQVFSISGQGLSENNHISRLNDAKALLENTKAEYERVSKLIEENIVSQKEYQQAKLAYEQAKVNYQTVSAGVSSNGKSITSPMNGYIKNILVQSGQYVEMGQALGTVTQNKRLILKADVSQRYLSIIKDVQTASFTTPYDNKTYELSDLNGRLLSFGKSSDSNSFYTPVSFEFDNKSNIIEGSFVEVYLKSRPIENTIVIPVTALIEEQGHFFVFVQEKGHDDEYIKKEVALGASDGINRRIVAGLEFGDKVVTNGAYALKLASLSNSMPEHSHEH